MKSAHRTSSRVLVVASHPDDEVIGCGGAIARHALTGDTVHVMILGEGATSRNDERGSAREKMELQRLSHAAKKAGKILGVQSLSMHGLPDNRMDSVDLLNVVKMIEEQIHLFQPDSVYTHHGGDLNIDHRLTHEAVITACRPVPGASVMQILFFETASSTEWQSPGTSPVFEPNWFVDITDTLALKLKAMRAYAPEVRLFPHPRSLEAIRHLSGWRGATAGVKAAEAFMLGRKVLRANGVK